MSRNIRAEEIEDIRFKIGEKVFLESLRESVVPPYLMLMPFCEVPPFLTRQDSLAIDEEGVHGVIFVLVANAEGSGNLKIGFKDMRSNEITHLKNIRCICG